MISGAYTSSEKAGRLFFKRIAVFFWEDSEWGAVQLVSRVVKASLSLFQSPQRPLA